ncbi:MAG TPA: hypothetical protein VF263_18810 [Longimicrobiaceae bacterium]
MIEESRQTIQLNAGFLVSPALVLDEDRVAAFRARLAEEGVEFEHAEEADGSVVLVRFQPSSLQVQLNTMQVDGPEPAVVTQIVLLAAVGPDSPVPAPADFADLAHEVTDAAREVWPEMEQVLGWSTGTRTLFAARTEHSFQYLWEQRLGQPIDSLGAFGRPVLGGGVRLMFPAGEGPGEQFQAEVRVETFLEDVRWLFVELNLASGAPEPISAMNPTALVQTSEEFLVNRVLAFLAAPRNA